jgi:hypothetical protein
MYTHCILSLRMLSMNCSFFNASLDSIVHVPFWTYVQYVQDVLYFFVHIYIFSILIFFWTHVLDLLLHMPIDCSFSCTHAIHSLAQRSLQYLCHKYLLLSLYSCFISYSLYTLNCTTLYIHTQLCIKTVLSDGISLLYFPFPRHTVGSRCVIAF